MMIYKTDEQVELMRQSALLVSKTLTEIAGTLKPGITTLSIDKKIGSLLEIIRQFLHFLIIMAILLIHAFQLTM